jgi:hypothetical protein
MRAELEITPEERDRLMALGFLHINDRERGEIKIWMRFKAGMPGIENRQMQVKVIRRGRALCYKGHH